MTLDEAQDDHETISLDAARRELKRHSCRIVASEITRAGVRIQVTNDYDPAEWIDSTPAAILAWLGY